MRWAFAFVVLAAATVIGMNTNRKLAAQNERLFSLVVRQSEVIAHQKAANEQARKLMDDVGEQMKAQAQEVDLAYAAVRRAGRALNRVMTVARGCQVELQRVGE